MSSRANSARAKKIKSKPEWDATTSDLNQYKLSKGEVERRKILMKSKNAAQVKNDFLQRDPNRAPTQAEIETELKRLQALRAALYDRDNLEEIVRDADEKIGNLPNEGTGFEGAVRVEGHVTHTAAPSDISSIHGGEEPERDCSTPNSCSSNNTTKVSPNSSVNSGGQPTNGVGRDISHSEASSLLEQVESALDKVTGSATQRPTSFTARLLGTLTQTVKFVADCESRLLEEAGLRLQLSLQVEQQKKLIDALTKELLEFHHRFQKLEDQVKPRTPSPEPVERSNGESESLMANMNHLVNLLRQPGAIPSTSSEAVPVVPTEGPTLSFADLADALGDKMTEQKK